MKVFACLLLISFAGLETLFAADSLMVAKGEGLFKKNCTACHQLKQRLVGPALQGVDKRHSEEWLLKFIPSTQTMIKSGDSVAVALFNTYNKVIMPDQKLTADEIRSILSYVKDSETAAPSVAIRRPALPATASLVKPLKFSDYRFWILYTITVLLVIVSIYYKAELIALEKKVEQGTDE